MTLRAVNRLLTSALGRRRSARLVDAAVYLKKRTTRTFRDLKQRQVVSAARLAPLRFGDKDHHYFFGYYDITPFSHDDSLLLSVRTPVSEPPASPHPRIEIGYFRLSAPDRFYPLDRSECWCWQQGCRLQWYPPEAYGKSGTILYNRMVNRSYGAVILNLHTRDIVSRLPRPVYALSPDGRVGYSLNFSRLARMRPGYGYTFLPDETAGVAAPENDGIWRIDMATGQSRLLFSIADIAGFDPLGSMRDALHYLNHICINPVGSRFLFFHVWVYQDKRCTRLITCDMDGGRRYALFNDGFVSHYCWRSPTEIVCFSSHADTGKGYYAYRDQSRERTRIGADSMTSDGHPTFSLNGNRLITDTYPDRFGEQNLLLYRVDDDTVERIGAFHTPFRYRRDLRCDLHPRWSPTGRRIAFDSAHDGTRAMYVIELLPQSLTAVGEDPKRFPS